MIKNIEIQAQHETTVKSFKHSKAEFIALPDGWRQYSPIDLAKIGGSLISTGSFSRVEIWMEPTTVHFSPSATVVLPGPNPVTGPKDTFAYPLAPQFDLVVLQCPDGVPAKGVEAKVNYTAMSVTATSENDCQSVSLDRNIKNLFVAFNDKTDAYYDNSGDVQLMVKLIP